MHSAQQCFINFQQSVSDIELPERFTFPFYYKPHPLCEIAAAELQQHLKSQNQWQHNFGLEDHLNDNLETADGKMFGVLVVENSEGKIGYLAGFSGKLANQSVLPHFVPPVFDTFGDDSFYLAEQKIINNINAEIELLSASPELQQITDIVADLTAKSQTELSTLQTEMAAAKKQRKQQRVTAKSELNEQQYEALEIELAKKSVIYKIKLRDLKLHWQGQLESAQLELDKLTNQIEQLKKQRKKMSARAQKKLFQQYRFLNINGEQQDLTEIFSDTAHQVPPSGAGECAAPKMLQYAFNHNLKPIAMAEFWWGASPKSEIKKHKNYYPSCTGKCQPILGHMLAGMEVDENPLLANPGAEKKIDILYEDEHILVINKPAGLLSVAGKSIKDSVQHRLRQQFPDADGPLIVHRLDMATSGLMVIALTKRANKNLQQQFVTREVKKRYVAIVDGLIDQDEGEINLPMRGDYYDLPKQLVCFEHGKPAFSKWQVVERKGGQTKVYLYPKTGRTHQLRVHCAHHLGLNTPIVGDSLYGIIEPRLLLHAESITFEHPITNKAMHIQVDEEF
ncbi:RluA family pseudouridine synthase [Thalassotalea crassostreae]|uniref:RluA family pseudouridine synthase n=1 Tax=Thalassotalea crassostreae TaxID=1763536 RepID=UPI000838E7D6|nr:RluA family pseudouridine synthase [Thalassotalea crassostreae]